MESQERKAKRLVEILEEMGILTVKKERGRYRATVIYRMVSLDLMSEKDFIHKVMEALGIYQAEELEKAWKAVTTGKLADGKK